MTQRLLFALLFAVSVHAQTTLASSTLSIAIGNERNITLGAPASAAVSVGQAMIMNTELAQVVQVNGRQLLVNRGQYGTTAASHAQGTTAWFGPVNAFVMSDPAGACVRTSLPYVPVVSLSTGNAYDCIGSVYTLVAGVVSVLGIPNGGTGNNTFAAGKCVQVAPSGNSLETAADPCGTGSGSSAFNAITSGTNTTATMAVGTGASLAPSGSGVVETNKIASLTGVVKATSGTPSVVSGTSTNCVLVDGTSVECQTLGLKVTRTGSQVYTIDAGNFAVGTQPASDITPVTVTMDTRTVTAIADLGGSPKRTRLTFNTAWSALTMSIADVLGICGATGTGTAGLNNTFTVQDRSDTTHADIELDSTGMTYGASSATAGCNPSASGYVYNAGEPLGTVDIQIGADTGIILTSTGGAVTINQVPSPTYNAVPLGAIPIVSGAFSGSAINGRTSLRGFVVNGGDGLNCAAAPTGTNCAVTNDVMRKSGGATGNVVTGNLDLTNSTQWRPRQGSSNPATCTASPTEFFWNTMTNKLSYCSATNTWTAIN